MELTGERFLPQQQGVIAYEHLSRYLFVVHQLNLNDKKVVDLASGEGYGSEILSRYASHVTGIDINYDVVKHANNTYKKENLEFIVGSASEIPLPDNFADVFVSFETIEHHSKHNEMISEIKRVLKPNGILFISSPDKRNYTENTGYINQYHVKELYYEEFKELLNKNFLRNYFFIQNNFSGSIILADFKKENIIETTVVSSKQLDTTIFNPLYNLSISTDNPDFQLKMKDMIFGEFNVLTQEDIFLAQQEIRRTAEYKLGRKILKRLSFLKKYL
jgi:ubiquinone/menaquinone biosynthesis C-methylase UbiE